jgi:hypothetical protein
VAGALAFEGRTFQRRPGRPGQSRPRRPPPAGSPFLPHGQQQAHGEEQDPGHGDRPEDQRRTADEHRAPEGGGRDDHAGAPGDHPIRHPRRPGRDWADRDIRGDRGQIRLAPRGERLARPDLELAFGQPAHDKGSLERLDHALAVGL